MNVAAVGVLFPVFLLAVIFGFIILLRYLRYRENMMFMERGMTPPVPPRGRPVSPQGVSRSAYYSPYRRLRGGIITSFVGLAILLGLWTLGTGPWLLGGLIPLAVGLGELLTFVIMSPTRNDSFENTGGPHDGNDNQNF